jgi:hypothetical protein
MTSHPFAMSSAPLALIVAIGPMTIGDVTSHGLDDREWVLVAIPPLCLALRHADHNPRHGPAPLAPPRLPITRSTRT